MKLIYILLVVFLLGIVAVQGSVVGGLNTVTESRGYTYDTSAPTVSNINIYSINGSGGYISTSLNFTELIKTEKVRVNFTLSDISPVNTTIHFYYTANGSSSCATGNKQSSTCFNYTNGKWIEFVKSGNTSNYDNTMATSGDDISCSTTGSDTNVNVSCLLDEHYNPNVWKHYPLNLSDVKWQSATTVRLRTTNIWKITLDTNFIPTDADIYKLDFRVNRTGTGTAGRINAYFCNSTYSTGNPATSSFCTLVASRNQTQLQDDGTKFRVSFEKSLISGLGNIQYAVVNSPDSTNTNYWALKTFKYLGTDSIRSATSTNTGTTYTNLSDGYESELNINWFVNESRSPTGLVMKVSAEDNLGHAVNSSEFGYFWTGQVENRPPSNTINAPENNATIDGIYSINWTAVDPNGNNVWSNVSLGSTLLGQHLGKNIVNITINTSIYANGLYNLTLKTCENDTTDLFCVQDTHEITIYNIAPVNVTEETGGGGASHSSVSNFEACPEGYVESGNYCVKTNATATYSVPLVKETLSVWDKIKSFFSGIGEKLGIVPDSFTVTGSEPLTIIDDVQETVTETTSNAQENLQNNVDYVKAKFWNKEMLYIVGGVVVVMGLLYYFGVALWLLVLIGVAIWILTTYFNFWR